ncbi:flagellar hook-length control protein FliK [Pectobacterium cacticida]|uniref:flagellar hook-length control protein FliK n=1 Tax=Pectobacterium cacticida TaxID=69221 RepID=UPI0039877D53
MNLSTSPLTAVVSDTSSSSASPLLQGELPKDFVDLLSKRLSQVADDASGKKTFDKVEGEALLRALGKDGASLSQDDLTALLSSFSALTEAVISQGEPNPEIATSASLKGLDKKESDETADDTIAMQALLAMLHTTPLARPSGAEHYAAPTASTTGLMTLGRTDTPRANEDLSSARLPLAEKSNHDSLASLLDTRIMPDKNADTSRDLHYAAKQPPLNAAASVDEAVKFTSTLPHSLTGDRHALESIATLSSGASQTVPSAVQAMHVQPASVGSTAPLPQPVSAQLNAPFGSPQWQDALGQQIIMFSRNGQQTVELRLNPQELGALHISLKMDDNQAQIHLASANSQVRSALEAALPHLRHAMAESGINLGQSSVGSESSAWQQQMTNNNDNDGRHSSYQQQFGPAAESPGELLDIPEPLRAMTSSVNGVDIFA